MVVQERDYDVAGFPSVEHRCLGCGRDPNPQGDVMAEEARNTETPEQESEKEPTPEERLARIERAVVGLARVVKRQDREAAERAEGEALLNALNEQRAKSGSNWIETGVSLVDKETG
jgi:hypothetical protein